MIDHQHPLAMKTQTSSAGEISIGDGVNFKVGGRKTGQRQLWLTLRNLPSVIFPQSSRKVMFHVWVNLLAYLLLYNIRAGLPAYSLCYVFEPTYKASLLLNVNLLVNTCPPHLLHLRQVVLARDFLQSIHTFLSWLTSGSCATRSSYPVSHGRPSYFIFLFSITFLIFLSYILLLSKTSDLIFKSPCFFVTALPSIIAFKSPLPL